MNSDEARKISEENTNSDQVSKYLRGIYLTIQTQAELGKTNCLQTCPAKLFSGHSITVIDVGIYRKRCTK